MSNSPQHDFVTGPEFKRWMDEEHDFRSRLELRMTNGFAEVKAAVALVAGLQRDANGKIAEHARLIAVIQRDVEAIRTEELRIERTVDSIKDDGCSQLDSHAAAFAVATSEPGLRGWVGSLNRPEKAVAVGGVTALVLPAVLDLVKIGYDALRWFESLHHTVVK